MPLSSTGVPLVFSSTNWQTGAFLTFPHIFPRVDRRNILIAWVCMLLRPGKSEPSCVWPPRCNKRWKNVRSMKCSNEKIHRLVRAMVNNWDQNYVLTPLSRWISAPPLALVLFYVTLPFGKSKFWDQKHLFNEKETTIIVGNHLICNVFFMKVGICHLWHHCLVGVLLRCKNRNIRGTSPAGSCFVSFCFTL